MNKHLKHLVWSGALLLLPLVAHAEIFICKDASGRTLTSDRPIMECQDRNVRVLGKNGLTQREIAPPMTAEQKRQKQAEDDKLKADAEAQKEQKRQDMALKARYKTEADIEADRKRTLDDARDQLKREEAGAADAGKRLKEVRAEADTQKKKPLSPTLQRQLDTAEQAVKDSQKRLAELQVEVAQINGRFDEKLKRFRELKSGAAPVASAPAPAPVPAAAPPAAAVVPAATAASASTPVRK